MDDVGGNVEPPSRRRQRGRSSRQPSSPTKQGERVGNTVDDPPLDHSPPSPSKETNVLRVDRRRSSRPIADYNYQHRNVKAGESSSSVERLALSPPQRLKENITLSMDSPSQKPKKRRSSKTSTPTLSSDTISRLLSIETNTITKGSTDKKNDENDSNTQLPPSPQKRILAVGGSTMMEPEKLTKSSPMSSKMMLPPRSPNSTKLRATRAGKSSAEGYVSPRSPHLRRVTSSGGKGNEGQTSSERLMASPMSSLSPQRHKTRGGTEAGSKQTKQDRRSSFDSLMSVLRMAFTNNAPSPASPASMSTKKKKGSSRRSAAIAFTESTTGSAGTTAATPGRPPFEDIQSEIGSGNSSTSPPAEAALLSQSTSVPTESKSRSSSLKIKRLSTTTIPPPPLHRSKRISVPNTPSLHTVSSSPDTSLRGQEFLGSVSGSNGAAANTDEEDWSGGMTINQPTRPSTYGASNHETQSLAYSDSTTQDMFPGDDGVSTIRWKRMSRSHQIKLPVSSNNDRDSLRLTRPRHNNNSGMTRHHHTSRAAKPLYDGAMVDMVEKMHGSGGSLSYVESLKISAHSQRRHSSIMQLTNTTIHRPLVGNDHISTDSTSSLPSFAVDDRFNTDVPGPRPESTHTVILVPSKQGKRVEGRKSTGSHSEYGHDHQSQTSSISSKSYGQRMKASNAAPERDQQNKGKPKMKDKSTKKDSIDNSRDAINRGEPTSGHTKTRGRSSTARRTKTEAEGKHSSGGIRHGGRRTSKRKQKERKALSDSPQSRLKLTVQSMQRMQSSDPAALNHPIRSKSQEVIPKPAKKEPLPSTAMSQPRSRMDIAMAISRLTMEGSLESDPTAISLPALLQSPSRGSFRSRHNSPDSCSRTVQTGNLTIKGPKSRQHTFKPPTSPYGYYSPWRRAQRRLSVDDDVVSTPSPGSSVSSSSVDITELIQKTVLLVDSEMDDELTMRSERMAERFTPFRGVASYSSGSSTPLHSSKSSLSSSSTSNPDRVLKSPNSVTDLQPGEDGESAEDNSMTTDETYNLHPGVLEIPQQAPTMHFDESNVSVHSVIPKPPPERNSEERHVRSLGLFEDPSDELISPNTAPRWTEASGMASSPLPSRLDASIPPPPFSTQLPIWIKIQDEKVRQERLKQRLRGQRS